MEHRERREPLGLSDLLLVYHDFLLPYRGERNG
jgi:hypothetical protein